MIDLISFEIVSRSTSPRLTLLSITLMPPLLCWQFLQLNWNWEFDENADEFEFDGKTGEFESNGKAPLFPALLSFC